MKQNRNNKKYRKVIFLFMILSLIKICYCYRYDEGEDNKKENDLSVFTKYEKKCENLDSNIYHCGNCGNICPINQKCVKGVCMCSTQLITFDDLNASGGTVPNGYKDFTWDNIDYITSPTVGDRSGVISPFNIIYSPSLTLSTISRSTPFNLVSIYGYNMANVATITFKGYRNNVEVATTTYISDDYEVRLFVFPSEFNNIDKLTFISVSDDLPKNIVFDNLMVCV
jgi:hypothetical protein